LGANTMARLNMFIRVHSITLGSVKPYGLRFINSLMVLLITCKNWIMYRMIRLLQSGSELMMATAL
jgi:hypothetical protein